MIIPSIDIMGGRAVQLVGGSRMELDCGDPLELADRFSIYGQIAVIDLDAAMGLGQNEDLLIEIARRYPCRLGGGVRDADKLTRFLDAGARAVIIGTRAEPDFLSGFPRDRLVAALDTRNGTVSVAGWKMDTGLDSAARLVELAPFVGGFLFTSIEREGALGGLDLDYAERIAEQARSAGFSGSLCFAGGVRSAEEVARLDAMGADVQAGMAIYKGILDPADALMACLSSDRSDGLWPTVVCDERGVALGLAYSDSESLGTAFRERAGVYRSRRHGLWRKGETSGNRQELLRVDVDCDRDTLRFTVRQGGSGFCHRGSRSCWGPAPGNCPESADSGIGRLERTIAGRKAELDLDTAPAASYSARLFRDDALLSAKLLEEASELAEASGPERAAEEAA
ncbi:MAG: hypothetical protein E4H20_11790, partial [Spirochaetales bacterium]